MLLTPLQAEAQTPSRQTMLPLTPLKAGALVVTAILLIYIVTHVSSLAKSPLGQALSSVLGTAGTVLAALASLPPWLLIGLGAAYLLGPAILKMTGSSAADMGRAFKSLASKVDALAEGGADAKALAEVTAAELTSNIRANNASAASSSAEARSLADAAAGDAAKIYAETSVARPAEASAGREIVNEEVPIVEPIIK